MGNIPFGTGKITPTTDRSHFLPGNPVVTSRKSNSMKKLLTFLLCLLVTGSNLAAQEKVTGARDSSSSPVTGITVKDCNPAFTAYLNKDILREKAALIVLNEALHPLGRTEFYEDGKAVKWLQIPLRMNRASLLYIEPGTHRYHTIYQRLYLPVSFEAGKIYLARLFSRKQWPLGGVSIIKKDEQGRQVEYAAVILEYISDAAATELYNKMNKKELLVNQ